MVVKQWSQGVVVFHLLLVLSILILFLTGDNEEIVFLHEIIGFFVGFLIIYRILHSFTTKHPHEKLSSWVHSIQDLIGFFKNLFTHKETKFHNPASSYMMITLLVVLVLTIITGSVGLAGKEAEGILSNFISVDRKLGKLLLDIHEFLTDALLVLILTHIAGAITSSIIAKSNLIKSIFVFTNKND